MSTMGDRKRKAHMRQKFADDLDQIPGYQLPFWKATHEKAKEICADDCTKNRAITLLLDIARDLLERYRSGEVHLKDLHFLTECFNVAMFIYGDDLYDILDQELWGITEIFDHDDRVDYMESELANVERLWKQHQTQ